MNPSRAAFVEMSSSSFGFVEMSSHVKCYAETCALAGKRTEFEDSHLVYTSPNWTFVAVMDGHVGRKCTDLLRDRLEEFVMEHRNIARIEDDMLENLFRAIQTEATRLAENADPKTNCDGNFGGSTLTGCVVYPYNECSAEVQIFNVGDSRTHIVEKGVVSFRTTDHRPDEPSETERIESGGGCIFGGRISGLAVSRSFGDSKVSPLVTAEPDITHVYANYPFDTIVCCDGVFEQPMYDTELVGFTTGGGPSAHGAYRLCIEAYIKGSFDNISAVHCRFSLTEERSHA